MFDTMTMVKALGGLCGAFLVFLLGGWTADIVYGIYGHDDHHEQAYVIEIESEDGPAEPVEEGPSFEELFLVADAGAGETSFARACASCHKVERGENATGPYLYGVVGREVDTAEGFTYSGALEEVVQVWTPEELDHFITAPRDYAPGTSMTYTGMDNPETRANIIAYLATIGG